MQGRLSMMMARSELKTGTLAALRVTGKPASAAGGDWVTKTLDWRY
jgi:hypothetical protein